MKKKLIFVFVLASALLAFSITFAAGETGRYFVASDSGILKAITGVRHNFDNGYTAELTQGQLKALGKLTSMFGVSIESVDLYHITANGNGAAAKGKPQPTGRQYYPADQMPWGIETMYYYGAASPSYDLPNGGAGIDVAVLDTGVYKSHLDLARRVKQCKDFTKGFNIANGCDDKNGHGTHVAGTILADAGADGKGIYGVAPGANLFAYKVCGNDGSCWADDIAAAIRYATDNGAEIISMSLGADAESSLIRDAIGYATAGDKTFIAAAAGNDGPDLGSIDYPAANSKVAAVGALNNLIQVPDWSSRGINNGDYIIEEKEVEFGAPGVNIQSTWLGGQYYYLSGTSMATPHISGLAAKFWQGSASSTRAYLQSKAHDIWTLGDDPATGLGLPTVY